MSDDDTELTPEEWAAVGKAWREFVEDKAHNGKLHFSPVKVHGMPLPGSFRFSPKDIAKLGNGDLQAGGFLLQSLFGIEDDPAHADCVHPSAVRIIGNGSLAKGQKVLQRFVQMLRKQGAQSRDDSFEQPDGTRPARVIR
jgi:hypothetical protein